MSPASDTPQAPDPPPPEPDGTAIYFDGTSSRKRRVTLRYGEGALDLIENGEVVAHWLYGDIRRVATPGTMRVRCLSALPLARLELPDEAAGEVLRSHCPLLDADRAPRQTWRIVGWSLAAIVSIVLMTVYGIPLLADRLAPFVPYAVEKRLGEGVERQVRIIFDGRTCRRADGQAAFVALVNKLGKAGGMDGPFEAEVISSSVPNAFALPGGKVYLLDGLLQKAQSADEIAGVLAHELGHVKHRDHMRKLIQNGGTSFIAGLLLGDITGGSAVIFATRSILGASYSRDAERAADAFAIETMQQLGRSARPMGELLVRVTSGRGARAATILDSHPLSNERLDAMKRADRPISGPDILSSLEWNALKNICRTGSGGGAGGGAPVARPRDGGSPLGGLAGRTGGTDTSELSGRSAACPVPSSGLSGEL
jgi:Zn-dependent protease with chaperone function